MADRGEVTRPTATDMAALRAVTWPGARKAHWAYSWRGHVWRTLCGQMQLDHDVQPADVNCAICLRRAWQDMMEIIVKQE